MNVLIELLLLDDPASRDGQSMTICSEFMDHTQTIVDPVQDLKDPKPTLKENRIELRNLYKIEILISETTKLDPAPTP